MSLESPPSDMRSTVEYNHSISLSDEQHADIKTSITTTANQIFGTPSLQNVNEIRGLPYESLYVPDSVVQKIGPYWEAVNIAVNFDEAETYDPFLPPLTIQLIGNRFGDVVSITTSTDLPWSYDSSVERRKTYAQSPSHPEERDSLSDDEVTAIIRSALGLGCFERQITDRFSLQMALSDIALLYPECERVIVDKAEQAWFIGETPVVGSLIRSNYDNANDTPLTNVYTFRLTTEPQLALDECGENYAECTVAQELNYSFNSFFGRMSDGVSTELQITFGTNQPITPSMRDGYKELDKIAVEKRKASAVQTISQGLGTLASIVR
jgi:hypothetical protein